MSPFLQERNVEVNVPSSYFGGRGKNIEFLVFFVSYVFWVVPITYYLCNLKRGSYYFLKPNTSDTDRP